MKLTFTSWSGGIYPSINCRERKDIVSLWNHYSICLNSQNARGLCIPTAQLRGFPFSLDKLGSWEMGREGGREGGWEGEGGR